MEYRVEQKYIVNEKQIKYLQSMIGEYMSLDSNMRGDSYLIRSLYFDDMVDSCLKENEDGTDDREKFRIRTYDNDSSLIKLELKGKLHGYTSKRACELDFVEANRLINREEIFGTNDYLKTKISAEMQYRRLQPVCIVEYERTAYVDAIGNVRITIDRNISGCYEIDSFWDDNLRVYPVLPLGIHVLEVKYDELLPDYIKSILSNLNLHRESFSKYYYVRTANMIN